MNCYIATDENNNILDCQVVHTHTNWGFSRFLHQVVMGFGVSSIRGSVKDLSDTIDEDSAWVVVIEGQFMNFVGMVEQLGDGFLILVNDSGHRVTCPTHLARAFE